VRSRSRVAPVAVERSEHGYAITVVLTRRRRISCLR
jgi:hypothetical protein